MRCGSNPLSFGSATRADRPAEHEAVSRVRCYCGLYCALYDSAASRKSEYTLMRKDIDRSVISRMYSKRSDGAFCNCGELARSVPKRFRPSTRTARTWRRTCYNDSRLRILLLC